MSIEKQNTQEDVEITEKIPSEIEEDLAFANAQDIAQNLSPKKQNAESKEAEENKKQLKTKVIELAEKANLRFKEEDKNKERYKNNKLDEGIKIGTENILKALGYHQNVSLEILKKNLSTTEKANLAYTVGMIYASLLLREIEKPVIDLNTTKTHVDETKIQKAIKDGNTNELFKELGQEKINAQQEGGTIGNKKIPLRAYSIAECMRGKSGWARLRRNGELLDIPYKIVKIGNKSETITNEIIPDENLTNLEVGGNYNKALLEYEQSMVFDMIKEIYKSLCNDAEAEDQIKMPEVHYFGTGDGSNTTTFLGHSSSGGKELFIYPQGADKSTHRVSYKRSETEKDSYISILPQGCDDTGGEIEIDIEGILFKAVYEKDFSGEGKLRRIQQDMSTGIIIQPQKNMIKIPSGSQYKNISITMRSNKILGGYDYDEVSWGISTDNVKFLPEKSPSLATSEKDTSEEVQEGGKGRIQGIVAPVQGIEKKNKENGGNYEPGIFRDENFQDKVEDIKQDAYDRKILQSPVNVLFEVTIDSMGFKNHNETFKEYQQKIEDIKQKKNADNQLIFSDKAYSFINAQAKEQVKEIKGKDKELQRMLLELRAMLGLYEFLSDANFTSSWNEEKGCYTLFPKQFKDTNGIPLAQNTLQIFPRLLYIPEIGQRAYRLQRQKKEPGKVQKELTK